MVNTVPLAVNTVGLRSALLVVSDSVDDEVPIEGIWILLPLRTV
jgi:hypothetical protein